MKLFETAGPFTAIYMFDGPVRRVILYKFKVWTNLPVWFNKLIGRSIRWRAEICAWWLRLVDYGTPSEKCLALLWFMMLAARLIGE